MSRNPGAGRVAAIALGSGLNMRRRFSRCGRTVMTATAGTHDLRMIDANGRHPLVGVVAAVAGGAAIDVITALCYCPHAVVTRRARLSDTGVVEAGRLPSGGVVTADAIVTALDMYRWLAGGDGIVVATLARAFDIGVIDARHHRPGIAGVAGLAGIGGGNVRRGARGSRHHTVQRVAAYAFTGRALELPGYVAAFATHRFMRPFQRKARGVVVKICNRRHARASATTEQHNYAAQQPAERRGFIRQ